MANTIFVAACLDTEAATSNSALTDAKSSTTSAPSPWTSAPPPSPATSLSCRASHVPPAASTVSPSVSHPWSSSRPSTAAAQPTLRTWLGIVSVSSTTPTSGSALLAVSSLLTLLMLRRSGSGSATVRNSWISVLLERLVARKVLFGEMSLWRIALRAEASWSAKLCHYP